MATEKNISIMRGDTYIGFQFQCLVNGAPHPLTNATLKCDIRKGSKTGERVLFREPGSGLTVIDPDNGWAQFDKLKWSYDSGEFYYDIEVIDDDADNETRTFVKGKVYVEQDVTK